MLWTGDWWRALVILESVEIPITGNVTKCLDRYHIYYITKAEFNVAEPLKSSQNTTRARVILYAYSNGGGVWWQGTQICYLAAQPGMISQNLDLRFKDGSPKTFRVEGENLLNETFPVVLKGFLAYDVLDVAIFKDYTNEAANKYVVIFAPLSLTIAFVLVHVLI